MSRRASKNSKTPSSFNVEDVTHRRASFLSQSSAPSPHTIENEEEEEKEERDSNKYVIKNPISSLGLSPTAERRLLASQSRRASRRTSLANTPRPSHLNSPDESSSLQLSTSTPFVPLVGASAANVEEGERESMGSYPRRRYSHRKNSEEDGGDGTASASVSVLITEKDEEEERQRRERMQRVERVMAEDRERKYRHKIIIEEADALKEMIRDHKFFLEERGYQFAGFSLPPTPRYRHSRGTSLSSYPTLGSEEGKEKSAADGEYRTPPLVFTDRRGSLQEELERAVGGEGEGKRKETNSTNTAEGTDVNAPLLGTPSREVEAIPSTGKYNPYGTVGDKEEEELVSPYTSPLSDTLRPSAVRVNIPTLEHPKRRIQYPARYHYRWRVRRRVERRPLTLHVCISTVLLLMCMVVLLFGIAWWSGVYLY